MKKAFLFDLDGTLLPLDNDKFMRIYFGGLSERLAPYGYEPKKLIDTIWLGTAAMVKNDGSRVNEQAFWSVVESVYGKGGVEDFKILDEYYEQEFSAVASACVRTVKAKEIIDTRKRAGARLILATNPIFPRVATLNRIKWAGLNAEDFELITSYENSRYCKPNLKYYEEILEKTGLEPTDCVMIGNDADEDMVARELGLEVFLLTDCLLNRKGKDISIYPNGDFDALTKFVKEKL